jgi:hypothetical protein
MPRMPMDDIEIPSPPPNMPPTLSEEASIEERVENVIRNHTAASALRMLTVADIATYLSSRDVVYDPADRKGKLLDTARKLVLSSESTSSHRKASEVLISLPRPQDARKRLREESDAVDGVPTSAWTVQEIRKYAHDHDISLQGVAQRKGEMLRHVSNSLGRNGSEDLLGL